MRLDTAAYFVRGDTAVGGLGDHPAAESGQRDRAVCVPGVDSGRSRHPDVVPHLVARADPDTAKPLGLHGNTIRSRVFLDGDPRQQVAGRLLGGSASDALRANLDRRTVDPFDLDAAVAVYDLHFASGGKRIGMRPTVGCLGRQPMPGHLAAGKRQRDHHYHGQCNEASPQTAAPGPADRRIFVTTHT